MLTLLNANALSIPLADQSVQCVVTSPPYWGLRDYGVADQLGLEPTLEQYVENMVQVFREVWRVLRDDGTCWVNLGDSYASGMRSAYDDDRHKYATARAHDKRPPTPFGLKPKDLIGIPWRVAFALQADGWYLRSDIIWSKPNPMPESVTDRPTKAHEYLFLLSKSPRYYYDADAVRETGSPETPKRLERGVSDHHKNINGAPGQTPHSMNQPRLNKKYSFKREENESHPAGKPSQHRPDREDIEYSGTRNRRSVWTIATAPTPYAHFATYPPALVEPCIKAGTSERGCCPVCGAPWERVTEREPVTKTDRTEPYAIASGMGDRAQLFTREERKSKTLGWQQTCAHDADPRPCVVLDPFVGSGTTGMVARQLGRSFVGLDLSFTYLHDIARRRLELDALDAWTNGIQAGDDGYLDLPLFAEAQ